MKRSSFLISIIALILGVATLNCVAQNFIKPSKRSITKGLDGGDDFDKIVVKCDVEMEYSQNYDGFVISKVYGPDNVVDMIDMQIEDRTLTISFKDDNVQVKKNKDHRLLLTISSPLLSNVSLERGGRFNVIGTLNIPDDLSLEVSGNGQIELNSLRCGMLTMAVDGDGKIKVENATCRGIEGELKGSGSISAQRLVCRGNIDIAMLNGGKVALSGYGNEVKYSIDGAGEINADLLEASSVVANISGSGEIKCRAKDTLQVEINGDGEVRYRGWPVVKVDPTMKRNVKRMDN